MTLHAFLIFCLCSLIFWFPFAVIVVFALSKAAKKGDDAMHRALNLENPFSESKGEAKTPVGEKRGGEDNAAPLSFLNDRIVRPI